MRDRDCSFSNSPTPRESDRSAAPEVIRPTFMGSFGDGNGICPRARMTERQCRSIGNIGVTRGGLTQVRPCRHGSCPGTAPLSLPFPIGVAFTQVGVPLA
jgi:hypothetical protein